MNDKIKAMFGADVSEVEAKMLVATRATKAYEAAVKNVSKAAVSGDLTKSLAQQNEQLAKGMNILKGGAVAAGVSAVLGQMKAFSQHAKEMGSSASEAQKSAAAWGDEFKAFGDTIMGVGSSVLGTLAGWGRSMGEIFRDPIDKEYDEVAKSSEEAANRQIEALEKSKAAHKKAADEIPNLQKKLSDAQKGTENVGRNEVDVLQESQIELEKKLEATNEIRDLTVREAEQLKINIELEQNRAKLKALEQARIADKSKELAEAESQRLKAEADELANIAKLKSEDAKAAEEAAKIRYDYIWKNATDEQKLEQARKEGAAALAAYNKDKNGENLLALNKARVKWLELKQSIDEANKAASGESRDVLATGGRTRNEKGQLMRNGVIISEEDAARADKTRADNALAAKEISKEDHKKLLEEIRDALRPTKGA